MKNSIIHLKSNTGLSVSLSPFGATWLSCCVPISQDEEREVLLGCQAQDLPEQKAYLGATVGRYANRIANAQFYLGKTHHLSPNQENRHSIHGGADNFSYRCWETLEVGEQRAVFSLLSPDGDQGFPATLSAKITYTLDANSLMITYDAISDADSICALTNHAYFNLDGVSNGKSESDARCQTLVLPADNFLPVDREGIPCGELTSVADTPFDFRHAKTLMCDFEEVLQFAPVGGYDHSWYFGHCGTEKLVSRLQSADKRLAVSLYTTQPALHVYSGNFLAGTPNRQGGEYRNFAGVALETGCLPNSPNMPDFIEDCLIGVEKPYRHVSRYVFDWGS